MHKGHRARLKKRFIEQGLFGFDEHSMLELLLFFGIPMRDVNLVSHRLLNRFGSFSAVFDADFDEICAVEGVGEHCATLIKLIPQIGRYYFTDKCRISGFSADSEEFLRFAVVKATGFDREKVWLYLFDNGKRMIADECIFEGSVNSAHLDFRRVVELSMKKKAAFAVIVHNHPGGTVYPSGADIDTTKRIGVVLHEIGVELIEHYIVAGFDIIGIMHGGVGKTVKVFTDETNG